MVLSAGAPVGATTDWNGSEYEFVLDSGSYDGVAYESGGFDSANSTADEIVERPGSFTLSNFGTLTLNGYNGTGASPIASHPYTQVTMPGYATTNSLSGATFSVTQNHCNG